jgi:hypothetical protein
MANNFTNYLEDEILDHINSVGAFTMPTNVYAGLSTADPTETGGSIAEPSNSWYSRQAITFGASSGGAASNTNELDFGTSDETETLTHIFISDVVTYGSTTNILWHGPLTASQPIVSGNPVKILVGDLDVSID